MPADFSSDVFLSHSAKDDAEATENCGSPAPRIATIHSCMKRPVTASAAKTQFPRLLREVEAGETIAISRHDETVAYLIPRARLEALVGRLGILANPAAMRAIRQHEAGKLHFHPLSALDEDAG